MENDELILDSSSIKYLAKKFFDNYKDNER